VRNSKLQHCGYIPKCIKHKRGQIRTAIGGKLPINRTNWNSKVLADQYLKFSTVQDKIMTLWQWLCKMSWCLLIALKKFLTIWYQRICMINLTWQNLILRHKKLYLKWIFEKICLSWTKIKKLDELEVATLSLMTVGNSFAHPFLSTRVCLKQSALKIELSWVELRD